MRDLRLSLGTLIGLAIWLAGCGGNPTVQSERFTAALSGAEAAAVTLDFPFQAVTVGALDPTAADLIQADVGYVGSIDFNVSGGADRTVRLIETVGGGFNWTGQPPRWDVLLHPAVPLEFNVGMTTGALTADLAGVTLRELDLNMAGGTVVLDLPGTPTTLITQTDSGALTINLPAGAQITAGRLALRGGTLRLNVAGAADFAIVVEVEAGDAVLTLNDAPVEIRVMAAGSSAVTIRDDYTRTEPGTDTNASSWTASNFADAAPRGTISVNLEAGSLRVE
ncbi:MAG: hypothetical protein GYB67_15775 [Chloroflexi bacterium]|nr:hypothetical protein [Chloroflexota bacterium]